MMTETLLKNARDVILRTKAMHLRGEVVPEDQMLAFALADALIEARGSFEAELCALVATRRAFNGDAATMLKALQAECAALECHILAEARSATAQSSEDGIR